MDWTALWTFLGGVVHPIVFNISFVAFVSIIIWQLRICVSSGEKRELRMSGRIETLEQRLTELQDMLQRTQEQLGESFEACQGIMVRTKQMTSTMERCKTLVEDYASGIRDKEAGVRSGAEQYLRVVAHSVTEDLRAYIDEVHRSGVWVCDANGHVLKMVASSGFSREQERSIQLSVGESVAGTVLRTGKPRLSGNARAEPDYQYVCDSSDFTSLICVPIRAQKGIMGVLTVDGRKEDSFDQHDVLVAQAYASVAGLYLGLVETA